MDFLRSSRETEREKGEKNPKNSLLLGNTCGLCPERLASKTWGCLG